MALIKKPVNGMKDILPEEMELREYLMSIIRKTYASFGFSCIETPAVEHIENLLSKQGGDNEKLIFKILKRGEKLNLETAEDETDLTDSGLRYDLTLPLSRYYANNSSVLPSPFKALQIGSVWRADRPQKGRFRQFTQCDIDILGEAGNMAEIELILATTSALSLICPDKKFEVRINDRKLLHDMATAAGFREDALDTVLVILDKMDKIGSEGVRNELLEAGFSDDVVDTYVKAVNAAQPTDNLKEIMSAVEDAKSAPFDIVFDPTLVRGMGYYTGTIFEVSMEGFGGSVAGGGRYDKMIGRFTGQDTPACGFSIGFERIITILMDAGFKVPTSGSKTAFLYEKNMNGEKLRGIIREANERRAKGDTVLLAKMNKNKKFQKEQLMAQGYNDFVEFYNEELRN